jgi:hypothetical protein
MLVMRTIENPANSVGKLVGSEQTVRLYHFALAVYPLGLYRIEPRTVLGQKTTHDPHPFAALLDFSVVSSEPAPELFGDVPARVVPDENHDFLTHSLELLQAPRKEPRRYTAHWPPIHESQLRLPVEFGQIETVAGEGFRSFAGIVFGDRLLDEAQRLALLAPTAQIGQCQTAPPEHSSKKPAAHSGSAAATSISRSRLLLYFPTGGRER